MSNDENVRKNVDAFWSAIAPCEDAYTNDSFTYIAVRSPEGFRIIQARLLLNGQKPVSLPAPFDSANVRAGHFALSDASLKREDVVQSLLTGKLETPHGPLLFPANGAMYGSVFQPFHDDGLKEQSRFSHLTLFGGENREIVRQPDLDWEVRASPTPYDGLADVLNEFRPGIPGDVSRVEVVALTLVAVDFDSKVEGEVAKLGLRTSKSIDPSKVSVSYRVMEEGRVVKRAQFTGTDFTWVEEDTYMSAKLELPVNRASILHAIANYNGFAQQHYYFGDSESFQNPRRAAYEAFDPKLVIFEDILAKAQGPKPDSREFEAAIPWLFWMLGFGPAALVGVPRLSNAPDTLMSPPNGHIVVLETTVGMLKDDSKLPKLYDRALAVRKKLEHSSTRHIRVLPVIVTAKTLEEVRPDLEQARRLGIYVVAREEIEQLKLRAMFPPEADRLYQQAEQAVDAALERSP